MRRAVPVLAATGGTLVLLASFHSSPAPNGVVKSDAPSDVPTSTEPRAPSTTSFAAGPTATTTTVPTTPSTAPPNPDTRTVVGPFATNKWGTVQVSITLNGTTIVSIRALQLPGENSHSAALSRACEPTLRKEALEAQSADIDLVSGATLTSQSYIESLQGALDRAGP